MLVAGRPFTAVELQAMTSDGVLSRLIGRAYVPAGARATAELRARALSATLTPRVRQRAVAGRMTAAWIFGCAPPPELPVMLVESTRRLARLGTGDRLLVHEASFGNADTFEIAGLRVTSGLRTAVDLALHSEEDIALPVLRRMLAQPALRLTVGMVARGVEALPRQPHKQRARRILTRLDAG
ncbi:hypothetical protein GCM10027449_30000 [Sinomonas notoginsengisoli]